MADIQVRPYRADDRPRIRDICYRTGYMGDPVDGYWRDRRSFQDLFSGYYTDREPESLLVADRDGEVMGYLSGCVDTARALDPGRAALRMVAGRALWLRPGTAGFFWRCAADVLRARGLPPGDLVDPRWPAHLHINLLPQLRGRGVGGALMKAWLERLRALGVGGCHLGAFAENTGGIAFFERMGFVRHSAPVRVPGFRLRGGGRMHRQVLVQSLDASGGSG